MVNRRANTPQGASYSQPSISMQSASIGTNSTHVPFSTSMPTTSYNASPVMGSESPNISTPSFGSSMPPMGTTMPASNLENRNRLRSDELKQKQAEMKNRLKEQFGLN